MIQLAKNGEKSYHKYGSIALAETRVIEGGKLDFGG